LKKNPKREKKTKKHTKTKKNTSHCACTVNHKRRDILLLTITLANLNRFL